MLKINNEKIINLFTYILIILISIYLFQNIFSEGFLTKSDNAIHTVETLYIFDYLIPTHHWINGWYPYELIGMPLGLHYYQTGFILIGLLYKIGLGINLAYKLVLLFALIFPPIMLYTLLKNKFGFLPAIISSIAFLFQHEYNRMLLGGMWHNGIGIGLFILIIHLLIKNKEINIKKGIIVGLIFGLSIINHHFASISSLILITIFFIIKIKEKMNKKLFIYYFLILIIGFLTSFYYLYNFFELRNWISTSLGWGVGNTIKETMINLFGIFFSLKPHLNPLLNLINQINLKNIIQLLISFLKNYPILIINFFGIIGFLNYIKNKKKDQFLKIVLIFTIICLILGSGFWFLFEKGKQIIFINGILAYRFVYYGRFGLFIFASYFIFKLIRSINPKRIKKIILIICIVFLSLLLTNFFLPAKSYTQTSNEAPIYENTLKMWGWLDKNIDKENVRIVHQNFFDNLEEPYITKDSTFGSFFAYKYKIYTMGLWATVPEPTEKYTVIGDKKIFGKNISEISNEEIIEKSEAYNIKYIIAIEPNLKEKIKSINEFKIIKEIEPYTIFEFTNYEPSWLSSTKEIQKEIKFVNNQKILIKVINEYQENILNIKIAYHPYWKAYKNNQEIQIFPSKDLTMDIPLEKEEQEIILKYDSFKRKNVMISILTIIICILSLIIIKKNEKRI